MNNSESITALRLCLLYAIFAGLWVLFSDRLLAALISDPGQLTALQTYKGWTFVAITTVLLYFLLARELRKKRRQVETALQRAHGELERRIEGGTRELSTLLQISHNVVSTLELEPLLDLILDQLKSVVDYTSATIFILVGNDLKVVAHQGLMPPDEALRVHIPPQVLQAHPEWLNFHKPIIITDIQGNESAALNFQAVVGEHLRTTLLHIHSWMGVPLMVKKRLIGLLSLSHKEPNHYSPQQAELVFALANQVAAALENARLYAETKQHADELETLLAVQQAVTSRLDLAAVLQLIADEARRLTNTQLSMVYLLEGEDLRVAVFSGQPSPDIEVGYRVPVIGSGAGLSIQSGQPILVQDAQRDPRVYADAMRRLGVRSYMAVPLVSISQPIGVIAIADKLTGQLDTGDQRIVTMLTSGAVIALENARLYQKEQERRQALEALYQADEELYRHLHIDQVVQSLVDVAVDVLQVDKSAVMVWDTARKRLVVQTARGFPVENVDQMTFGLDKQLIGQLFANGEPVVVEDTSNDSRVAQQITEPEGICSFIHVPIKINAQVFGIFNVSYNRPRAFNPEEQRLFVALSQRAALAIENARLYEQAQQTAALEERQRLARELHDAVTQNLFSASLITEILPKVWASDPDEGQQLLKDLRLLTRGALAEMRTLLLELRPAALAEASLSDLLRQLADAVMGRKGVPVEVKAPVDCTLPTDVRIGLYRIAQEALNNVAKHARASQVTVSLHYSSAMLSEIGEVPRHSVELCIGDDGRGFDPADVSSDHLGLNIMRERAEAIGATLKIESEPDCGTQVTVSWADET